MVAFAPELAAYRALRSGDDGLLGRALRLEPGLAIVLEEVGTDVRAVFAESVREEEERLALLLRARLLLEALDRAGAVRRSATAVDALSGPPGERRLQECQNRIVVERAQLADGILVAEERISRLLAEPGSRRVLAEVAALREAEAGVVEALRLTDQPTSIRLIGLPPRRRR